MKFFKASLVVALLVNVILLGSITKGYADLNNDPIPPSIMNVGDDSQVCKDIQAQVDHIPLSESVFNWPKKLHFSWLTWPSWTDVNPYSNEDATVELIKKYMIWGDSRGFYTSDNDYLKITKGSQVVDEGWRKFWLPALEAALKTGTLQMQTTEMTFLDDDPATSTAIIRFRAKPSKDVNFRYLMTHLGVGPLYSDGNWSYIVHSSKINASLNDTPIDPPYTYFVVGEMAYIYSVPVVFETGNGYISHLHFISIRSDGDQYHSIGASDGCFINMPAYKALGGKIPSPLTFKP